MRNAIDTLAGVWELMRMMLRSRFRMRNGYWRWRFETAFGNDPRRMPSRRARFMAMIAYGRWVHRMRKLG